MNGPLRINDFLTLDKFDCVRLTSNCQWEAGQHLGRATIGSTAVWDLHWWCPTHTRSTRTRTERHSRMGKHTRARTLKSTPSLCSQSSRGSKLHGSPDNIISYAQTNYPFVLRTWVFLKTAKKNTLTRYENPSISRKKESTQREAKVALMDTVSGLPGQKKFSY